MASTTGIFCGPYAHAMNAEVEKSKTSEALKASEVFYTKSPMCNANLTSSS